MAMTTASPIRSLATGRSGGGGPAASSGPRGVTVAGELKSYAPVTDAMLRNPPAGDWLMARRNYQAWSYSPLNQITTENVKNLRLKLRLRLLRSPGPEDASESSHHALHDRSLADPATQSCMKRNLLNAPCIRVRRETRCQINPRRNHGFRGKISCLALLAGGWL